MSTSIRRSCSFALPSFIVALTGAAQARSSLISRSGCSFGNLRFVAVYAVPGIETERIETQNMHGPDTPSRRGTTLRSNATASADGRRGNESVSR